MKKYKVHLMLMIALLLNCSYALSQSNDNMYHISSTGGLHSNIIDSVTLPIELIRKANVKLIQAEADAQLKKQLHNIIETYKSENELLESALNRQKLISANAITNNIKLESENVKLRKQRNTAITIGSSAIGVLILLIVM